MKKIIIINLNLKYSQFYKKYILRKFNKTKFLSESPEKKGKLLIFFHMFFHKYF